MKHYWHKKQNHSCLLLIFNGWGCDAHILNNLEKDNYDILLFYDYTTLETDLSEQLQHYKHIDVLAWSLGVYAADTALSGVKNIRKQVALNGTLYPVNDQKGIPRKIFEKTLQELNEHTVKTFFQKIAGTEHFDKPPTCVFSRRSFQSQFSELVSLAHSFTHTHIPQTQWDLALIAVNDRIFPYRNMQRAWGKLSYPIKGNHYVDFQKIIDEFL